MMADAMDISRIADEHGRLLQTIIELESAPAELRETIDLIKVVKRDLADRQWHLRELVKKRKSEAKDVDKLQRSGTKRFFFKLRHGGKEGLERKLEKEEREYIEAAQAEYNENQAIQELKETLQVSELKKVELESNVDQRKQMLQQINDLYTTAFSGPTPAFPEEDAAEDELKAAEIHNEEVQARLAHETHVFSLLDRAAACANQALASLQNANRNATYDTFGFGGIWAEMAEQDDLVRAQSLASQAERHMKRAREVQPLVAAVQGADVVSPEWLNVVFDNLYTDFVFQQKIRQSISSMTRFQQGIFAQCKASENRIKQLEHDAADAKEFLTSRRRQLLNVRREILTRIREEGPSASGLREAPPAYHPDQPPSPVGLMPGAFPDHTGMSASGAIDEGTRPPVEPAPPSYSSEEHHLHDSNTAQEQEVHLPSSPRSPAVHVQSQPRFAPPPGPPPQHIHHTSGVEDVSNTRDGSARSSRSGSSAPGLTRTDSNSARASVYASPPGPPPTHVVATGPMRLTHDGLVRTSSASSSSFVTSLSRPGTPSSPFGANALLHPHSPSGTPPRSRSPSPLMHPHSSGPSSPLLPAASPFSPADIENKSLPSISPLLPAPSIPSYGTSAGAGQSSSAAGEAEAPISRIGSALLWGAPGGQHEESADSSFASPPSMPIPEPFSLSDAPHASARSATAGSSTEDVGEVLTSATATSIGNETSSTGSSTHAESNTRSQFASNNPFRNFAS